MSQKTGTLKKKKFFYTEVCVPIKFTAECKLPGGYVIYAVKELETRKKSRNKSSADTSNIAYCVP